MHAALEVDFSTLPERKSSECLRRDLKIRIFLCGHQSLTSTTIAEIFFDQKRQQPQKIKKGLVLRLALKESLNLKVSKGPEETTNTSCY